MTIKKTNPIFSRTSIKCMCSEQAFHLNFFLYPNAPHGKFKSTFKNRRHIGARDHCLQLKKVKTQKVELSYICSYLNKNVCKWLDYQGWWLKTLNANNLLLKNVWICSKEENKMVHTWSSQVEIYCDDHSLISSLPAVQIWIISNILHVISLLTGDMNSTNWLRS